MIFNNNSYICIKTDNNKIKILGIFDNLHKNNEFINNLEDKNNIFYGKINEWIKKNR